MRNLALALAVLAAPAGAQVFSPSVFRLENGLQVVVVENDTAPVITQMVWYKVGSADDPPGKSGLAHYLEHLMFKGTTTRPEGDFSKIVAANGGRDNAFTYYDYTAYFQTIAADRLDLVMSMEADRMRNLLIDPVRADTERAVILEERGQTVEALPARRFGIEMDAVSYVHHPYGTPVIGWRAEMETFTAADAQAFYGRHYAPDNAILVVVGDVEADDVRDMAERYFGDLTPSGRPRAERPLEPALESDRRLEMRDPQVRQPQFSQSWRAPNFRDRDAYHALQVLSDLMGGGATGRLYRALVLDTELAAAAAMGYTGDNRDFGTLDVFVSPAPGVEPAALEAAVKAELARLLADGVTDAEVDQAKQRLIDQAIFARDGVFGAAMAIGATLAVDGEIDDIEEWPQRIGAVTPDQVIAAARQVLDGTASVAGWLLPPTAEGQP